MRLDRRTLLRLGGVAAGAAVLMRPLGILGEPLAADDAYGTSRASRLFPGQRLVHADMHNHTRLSDGDGDPVDAYGSMRDAGLDVAALTDHAVLNSPYTRSDLCAAPGLFPIPEVAQGCTALAGLTEAGWQQTADLATANTVDRDRAVAEGLREFLAVRGFEWSSPTLGHVNVWFSDRWVDVVSTLGLGAGATARTLVEQVEGGALQTPVLGPLLETVLFPIVDGILDGLELAEGPVAMTPLHRWLASPPHAPLGGGADGLAGFNHPGREVGRFGQFAFDPALQDRIVSLELMNRREDYLFEGTDAGQQSPLVQCLARGWTPALIGVTDEHGTDWGNPDGKGRAGYWVGELTANGVKEAMLNRRGFATRVKGLRLDVALNGVRMGGRLGHRGGGVRVQIDVDAGADARGRPLVAQVLGAPADRGALLPDVVHVESIRIPRTDDPVVEFVVPAVDPARHPWLVVRICDPAHTAEGSRQFGPDARAAGTPFEEVGPAWAYSSPVWLDPTLDPPEDDRAPLTRQPPGAPPPPAPPPSGGGTPPPSPTPSPSPTGDPDPPGTDPVTATVRRHGGATRIETAVALSRSTFPEGTEVVLVATAVDFPDALASVPAAAVLGGPLLLVQPDALPGPTAEEIRRLGAVRAVVLGGPQAVGPDVEAALADLVETVDRVGGLDRYETAALVAAAHMGPGTDVPTVEEVAVASGEAFPDALAGGPAMAMLRGPVLLTRPDDLPAVTADAIRRLGPQRILVLGGTAAVGAAVEDDLRDLAPRVDRLAGRERTETAAAIADEVVAQAEEVVIATGEDFPDALAAGPVAAARSAPILLVTRDAIPPATDAELRRLGPLLITIAGGPAAVSPAVEEALGTYEVR